MTTTTTPATTIAECDYCGREVDSPNDLARFEGLDACDRCAILDDRGRAYLHWIADNLDDPTPREGNDRVPDVAEIDGRYLLVERSRYCQIWLTFHDTRRHAADAHLNQEYAEDWTGHDPELVDLDHPDRVFELRHVATFDHITPEVIAARAAAVERVLAEYRANNQTTVYRDEVQ